MTAHLHQHRQKALLDELDHLGLDALLLNAGPSLTYLTGLHFHLSERPVVAIFRPDGVPTLVLPALEEGKLADLPYDLRAITYGEDPTVWSRAFEQAVRETRLDFRRAGVEPQQFRVLELRFIEEAAPRAAYLDAEQAVSSLRLVKDAGEIDRMRKATEIAEDALKATLDALRPGITEREAASELTAQMLRRGSDPELPFSPIVAFGEATANPHAVASDRRLEPGHLVLFDWGARVDGYCSDLTRMFSYGETSDEMKEIVDVVREANEAARDVAGPDATAADVDRAARAVIEEAGYGSRFVHRTGHGLGMEVHEAPYIRGDNDEPLRPGMTFTIEPGIYIPGVGGARIEDDMLVTDDGADSFSSLERALVPIQVG